MAQIVITDLTRFQREDIVCTAGTDTKTGACIRPMPYLQTSECLRLNILPGAVLEGEFATRKGLEGPHQEDADYSRLAFAGPSTPKQFKKALEAGLHDTVSEGFEIDLAAGQKHVPIEHPLRRSIITVAVDPGSIEVVRDRYQDGKLKIHFSDASGLEFRFFPITDLGFHRYAQEHRALGDLAKLNAFIQCQPEAYLRVGLSRAWDNGRVNGFWMQVNGVYTFPDFFRDLRSYKEPEKKRR